MSEAETQTDNSFLTILPAANRSPDISPADDLYGWLIGSWELDLVGYDNEDNVIKTTGEAHFSWCLRAVQFKTCSSIRAGPIAVRSRRSLPTGMARLSESLIPQSAHGVLTGSIPTMGFARNSLAADEARMSCRRAIFPMVPPYGGALAKLRRIPVGGVVSASSPMEKRGSSRSNFARGEWRNNGLGS